LKIVRAPGVFLHHGKAGMSGAGGRDIKLGSNNNNNRAIRLQYYALNFMVLLIYTIVD
jgi:hypothetical protein